MWHLHNGTPYVAARTWVQDPDGNKRWVVVVKGTFDIHPDGRLTLADHQLPPLLAPEYHGVDAWGDVGAASGPLFVVLAVASGQRGYAHGRHVLAWASSDGGTRAALTLTLPIDPKDDHA